MSPPCPKPKDTGASLEQQAGKVLTGKGWEISTWTILLMLFTHFLPSVSHHGACKMGDTIFASREGTSPGPEHRQWLPLLPAAPTSHLSVGWEHLESLALHPSLIPIAEMLASTFWSGEDISTLVAKFQVWSEMEGDTCVLCFHQTGWIPQHRGSSLVPTP